MSKTILNNGDEIDIDIDENLNEIKKKDESGINLELFNKIYEGNVSGAIVKLNVKGSKVTEKEKVKYLIYNGSTKKFDGGVKVILFPEKFTELTVGPLTWLALITAKVFSS